MRTEYDGVLVGSDVPYASVHNDGMRMGQIQQVKAHTRSISTVAKVTSIKSRRTTSKRVHAQSVQVSAHNRKVNQNIPARPFLKESPYLTAQLSRMVAAEFFKAYKITFNG
jgi:phage gpG-like protein